MFCSWWTKKGGRCECGEQEKKKKKLLSIPNAHNLRTFRFFEKTPPQMLNIATFERDSLNCTRKSGNVGQACKICVHSLLSLFCQWW